MLVVHKSHHQMGPSLCMPEDMSALIDVCVCVCVCVCVWVSEWVIEWISKCG